MEYKIVIEENKKTNSFLICLNGGVLDVFDSEIFTLNQMIAYAKKKVQGFLRDGDSISVSTEIEENVIECPNCGSEKTRSYDNQPLHHPSIKEIKIDGAPSIDTEIYIRLICDECGHDFQVVGDIVLRPIKK